MSFVPDPGQGGTDFGSMVGLVSTGGVSAKAVEQAKAEAAKLVDAAKSGGFKISEEGVKPLREAIAQMQMDLLQLSQGTTFLKQAPRLGSHPYGHTVAQHDQKGAADDVNSAGAVLDQFKTVLELATEALDRASGKYKANEHAVADSIKTIQT
ncbi:hypothetical protein SAMN05421504_11568 [Amycolatopsis xylanica]|uniref:Uncharacterized protein n=1 Tax=Amycolatopsis xylanica TaxID=589385 RepID=A0A1H3SU94_9PSEU|nr:hypothetical protein [Amycolatopsis xylanica]SDZ40709.1 hypothetical protein SAMN05421504_11568 [Amycolatopsis xylanica]